MRWCCSWLVRTYFLVYFNDGLLLYSKNKAFTNCGILHRVSEIDSHKPRQYGKVPGSEREIKKQHHKLNVLLVDKYYLNYLARIYKQKTSAKLMKGPQDNFLIPPVGMVGSTVI